jgi:hypothetical protein
MNENISAKKSLARKEVLNIVLSSDVTTNRAYHAILNRHLFFLIHAGFSFVEKLVERAEKINIKNSQMKTQKKEAILILIGATHTQQFVVLDQFY